MPLWLLLLGGGALAWWFASRSGAMIPPVPGAPKYSITAPAAFYALDPSTSQGATPKGQLLAGTTVYATAVTPVLSSDQSYELVATPNSGTVWVASAYLSPA